MAYFSTKSNDYVSKINELAKPEYTSQYSDTISNLMNKITNREGFNYDFNADPLYQNYKDQYTKLGNEAAMNAAAAVSTQTGGYGNSYAATAAAQANQQYLTQLNNVIPDLYNAAMEKYQMETEDLYNQFNMYETEENRQYGQYRDNVSDYYNDYTNLANGYSTALNQEDWQTEFDYQKQRDAIADAQWQAEQDASNYQYNTTLAENKRQYDTSLAEDKRQYDASLALDYAQLAASKAKSSSTSKSSGDDSTATYDSGKLTSGYTDARQYSNIMSELRTKYSTSTAQKKVADYLQTYVDNGTMSEDDALAYMDDFYNDVHGQYIK